MKQFTKASNSEKRYNERYGTKRFARRLIVVDAALQAERDGMQRQAGSPENIEAITAFMEKRKPDFSKLK